MKKTLSLSIAVLICINALAQKKPYSSQTFDSNAVESLQVQTSNGNISVIGGNESETVVEVYIVSSNNSSKMLSKKEIEERLENYTISIEMEGRTLVCSAKSKESVNWKKGLDISFKVQAPAQLDAKVKTSDGNISLKNLEGEISGSSSDGNISLTALSGDIMGRTSDGNIAMDGLRDKIEVSTSDGNIAAQNLIGSLQIKTSDGNIGIKDVEGNLRVSTSDGNIALQGISGSLEARTGDGDITANFDAVEDHVSLRTGDGNIAVKMPMDEGMDLDLHGNRISMNEVNDFNGKRSKNHIEGQINGGGIPVKISTSDGDITLSN